MSPSLRFLFVAVIAWTGVRAATLGVIPAGSLLSVQVSTEGEPRIGTSWSEVTRGGFTFALEITEFERPKRWAERARGRFADARLALDFEASHAGSTRLTLGVEVDFKGLARLGAPLVKAALSVALRGDLRRVEALARRAADR